MSEAPQRRDGSAANRIERWLFDAAFPFWAEIGLDREGPGFVEHLTLAGHPAPVGFKRVRVQARQIYCFCQAAELGWRGDALPLAARAVELLIGSAWLGRDRGWATTLTRDGAVLDATPDLYDIAFVLFALGWWHRLTGDKRVPRLAHDTLDFLDARMRHPTGQGYWHRLGGALPHLQNPHMHLTEAMLVLRDATGDSRFAAEADALCRLCLERFYDRADGTLAEEFDGDWGRHAGPHGVRLEPGHHFEWVWLLDQYLPAGTASDDPARQAMRGLFGFASAHGPNPAGLVIDAVAPDGRPLDRDCRLWPQAERLKAWLAMAAREGLDAERAVEDGVAAIFRHYLDTVPAGTWIEYRDADMNPKIDKIPTSSFYHLVLAFAEVLKARRGGSHP